MSFQRLTWLAACFCLFFAFSLSAQMPLEFVGAMRAGSKTVVLNGTAGHVVSMYKLADPGSACDSSVTSTGTLLQLSTGSGNAGAVTLTVPPAPGSAPPFVLTLANVVYAGDALCAQDKGLSGANPVPTAVWSTTAAVVQTSLITPTAPKLDSRLQGGGTTMRVRGRTGDTLRAFVYPPELADKPTGTLPCDEKAVSSQWDPLLMNSVASPSVPTTDYQFTTDGVALIALPVPLVAGSHVCLTEQTPGDDVKYAEHLYEVKPLDNYWRTRVYFLAGIQASNQLSANTSSTAGQYLEGGWVYSWLRAEESVKRSKAKTGSHAHPGISTNIDVRLSPIPVAATQTATTPGATTGAATTTTIVPSVLSSQQAVRVVGSAWFPFKATHDSERTEYFTLGPIIRGGFGTLLNPSAASTGNGTGSSLSTVTSTNFNNGYYFWSMGARIAWDHYPKDHNMGPEPLAQFAVTMGDFSNLTSFVCLPAPDFIVTATTPAPPNVVTACNQGNYAPKTTVSAGTTPVTTSTHNFTFDRTLRPRIHIEAFARYPGSPFVLGMDANLQQYAVFSRDNLDYLNKPGNDIRIFVGVTINLASLLSHLGTPTQ